MINQVAPANLATTNLNLSTDERLMPLVNLLQWSALEQVDVRLNDLVGKFQTDLQSRQELRSNLDQWRQWTQTASTVLIDGESHLVVDDEGAALLAKLSSEPLLQHNGQSVLSPSSQKAVVDETNLRLNQFGQQTELMSLELQNILNQRKQILEMLTNILSTSNDVMNRIIGNLKQ
jgi:archaellum biogenesis ATPase FlaH